jgi:hypothetical protein
MARAQRSGMAETTQAILTDDANFLRLLMQMSVEGVSTRNVRDQGSRVRHALLAARTSRRVSSPRWRGH